MPSTAQLFTSTLLFSVSIVGCNAFTTPSQSSLTIKGSTTSGSTVALSPEIASLSNNKPFANPLFAVDPSSGVDFVDSISNAWTSYNVALEQDPLITK